VLDTDYGCEMRNRFWLGIIESRDPDEEFSEADARAMRERRVNEELVTACKAIGHR